MDRRPTGIRHKGEPSKGRINLRLETTWAKTRELQARLSALQLGSCNTARCPTAEEAQHGAVHYSKAAQPRRHNTAQCATAKQHCGMRYSQRGTARRSAPQRSTPAISLRLGTSFLRTNAHTGPGCPHPPPFLIRVYMHGELPPQEGARRYISFTDRARKGPHLGSAFS